MSHPTAMNTAWHGALGHCLYSTSMRFSTGNLRDHSLLLSARGLVALLPLARLSRRKSAMGLSTTDNAFSVGVGMVLRTGGGRKLVYNNKFFARRWRFPFL